MRLNLQRKLKLQSATFVLAHLYRASMQKHGVLDYGETQTGASHLARTAFVHPIEALENALLLGLGDDDQPCGV